MLYPEKSMVNMMESSLAESMVPNANNIYDPMVSSSRSQRTQPQSHAGDKLLCFCFTLYSHRAAAKMHTQSFRKTQ